ncbi:hypothetical protein niasHT_018674 [Heterodera trifolii]|uniref:Uncharacterized protein n=1 Tax=Heterodera trifolii TaxID=157864 RepID=A0ABD2LIW6_9BILA
MFIDIHSLDTDDDDYETDFTTVTITPITLLEFKEYMRRLASASTSSPTTTSIASSSLSTILGQSTTTVKPTIQLLYSDSLDSTYGGGSSSTWIGEFIISLCSSVVGSEEGGCGGSHVWVWTRVFCCIVILLTLLCGILYAIRSIFLLKTKINHQTKDQVTNSNEARNNKNNNNNNNGNEQHSNREDAFHLSDNERVLQRMFSRGSDPQNDRITTASPTLSRISDHQHG